MNIVMYNPKRNVRHSYIDFEQIEKEIKWRKIRDGIEYEINMERIREDSKLLGLARN